MRKEVSQIGPAGLSPLTGGCNRHVTWHHLPRAAREGWARCQASPTNHMHLPGVRADAPGFKFLRGAQHQALFHDSFFQSKVKVSHPSSGLSSPQVKRWSILWLHHNQCIEFSVFKVLEWIFTVLPVFEWNFVAPLTCSNSLSDFHCWNTKVIQTSYPVNQTLHNKIMGCVLTCVWKCERIIIMAQI